jgi:PAS domain-containing protein
MATDERTHQVGYDIAITERARVEEELRGQALIFENIQDGIIVTDIDGNIIRWNPAAERMFDPRDADDEDYKRCLTRWPLGW